MTGIRNLYKGNEAYAVSGGLLQHLFSILSGVLQGCPLSGTLFVFVMDPLLWSFRRYLASTVTRSCADDIGMALRRLEVIALVFKLFEDFRSVSLLTLKPAKCVLITTVCATRKWNVDMIRAFLRRVVPAWSGISIRDSAKYLGFFIGRLADKEQWKGAIRKFSGRCIDLKHSEQPLAMSVGQFNGKVVPVLGYLAQLALPPPKMARFELSAILQALSLAGNSMTCEAAFRLLDFVGVSPTRPSVFMEASMIRAAYKTFVGWEGMHTALSLKAEDCSNLANAFTNMIPPGWVVLPFARICF